MSLDKFLSGNQPKKKKKSSKPVVKDDSKPKKTSVESSQPQSSKVPITEENGNITDTHVTLTENEVPSRVEVAEIETPIIDDSADQIFVPEFKSKNRNDLFQIILDIMHVSPTYSRNKNLIASYLAESPDEIIPEFLANQLEISVNEVLVLLAEIKNDFP